MSRQDKSITILVAEDDPDDRILLRDAFVENRLSNELRFVADGEELLDYLRHAGDYADARRAPTPGLILLDLNMPRMDGREALRIIKSDPQLQRIPIVVLTTSKAEEDIVRTYGLGVSSFIAKPVSFDGLIEVVRVLTSYWIQIVELPTSGVAA
ncbi:MAG: response regulator [Alphaproteobacteria bacterium]|nr:response regulator [Alphaproteobacteria bacterium]